MDLSSLQSIQQQLASRSISSRELTQYYLDRIAKLDKSIGSYLHVDAEGALKAADSIDAKRAKGETLGSLAGIPISVKDILCTRSMPTTCASKMLDGYMSPFDAHVVERLHQSDAIILGKTNLDEFAMGGSTETGFKGPSRNPWNVNRTCGGSSGGSAASVAAGLAAASIGTDTGGSIRQPAAFCGVCGLKPTYGRVSRYGLIAYASSLDQAGPFGLTVPDLAIMLEAISGHDHRDSTSLQIESEPFVEGIDKPIAPYRVGFVPEHLDSPGLDPEIRQKLLEAIEIYRKLGCEIIPLDLPHHRYAIPTYYIVAPSEASSNLSRYDGAHYGFRAEMDKSRSTADSPLVAMYKRTRSQGFGSEVKRRIMLGTYTLSAGYYDAYYLKALKVRRLIRQDYDSAFQQVDAILGPTTPTTPFELGAKKDDPVQMYLEDLYTVSANLAGIPALSIPMGMHTSGLPMGLQLQGAPLSEAKLLAIANAYHREIGYQPRIAVS
ncbi:Asp-tRNA(Asn)/Glu-tRNA(Gln) amidotransferase subunit GatA [Pirellulaceae bacterium SH501]